MKPTNEPIQFRLIQMPCCNILICWANPRRPNYCPECGTFIFRFFPKGQWEANYSEAWLRVKDYDKATYICSESLLQDDLKKIVVEYHNGEDK